MEFKYKLKAQGYKIWDGMLQDKELVLDVARIPLELIIKANALQKYLVLHISDISKLTSNIRFFIEPQFQMPQGVLVFEIQGGKNTELKNQINAVCSRNFANLRKLELESLGVVSSFATVECPNCRSTVDTSELDSSPHTYCPYCEAIFSTNSKEIIPDSLSHSICPQCQMYGEVASYTDFFFYFLIFIAGYRYQTKTLCPSCAHKMANMMFLKNAIFVLGLIPATWAKVKAMRTGDKLINKARGLSSDGKYRQAEALYANFYAMNGNHPAVMLNEAMGHLFVDDVQGGVAILTKALQDCSNYYPAIRLIQSLQKSKPKNY